MRGVELVVGEAAQQAGLAHPGVPDQQQPEQHIVLLRHGWGRSGRGLRAGSGLSPAPPLPSRPAPARGRCGRRGGRRARPPRRPHPPACPLARWVPGSAAAAGARRGARSTRLGWRAAVGGESGGGPCPPLPLRAPSPAPPPPPPRREGAGSARRRAGPHRAGDAGAGLQPRPPTPSCPGRGNVFVFPRMFRMGELR